MDSSYLTKLALTILLASSILISATGQDKTLVSEPEFGTISGIVKEKSINESLEYANIVLYKSTDSSLVNGTITNENGIFNLENIQAGIYYLEIDFLGFEKQVIKDILINNEEPQFNLGTIYLNTSLAYLNEVEVTAEKDRIVYKIDKKIINVNKDIVSSGGAAVEVLENVPSVEVDIEGNVSMRGSSNFQVLIDGRPSVLEGNDALQQISASSIDHIEIITNPSVKYDPDGVGGIINLILKEQQSAGLSGMVNTTIGLGNKYKADVILNLSTKKLNLYAGVDFNYRDLGFTSSSIDKTYSTDTNFYRISEMNGNRLRKGVGAKTGIDYDISENTNLSLSGQYNIFASERNSPTQRLEYIEPSSIDEYSKSNTISGRDGNSYNLTFNALHKFNDQGHQLEAVAYYSNRSSENTEHLENYNTDDNWNIIDDQPEKIRTIEEITSDEFRIRTDYAKPTGLTGFFEAGYQSRFYSENGNYMYQGYNYTAVDWDENDESSNDIDFKRNIHSAYAMFSNQWKGIGYQFGLRGEYTDRSTQNSMSEEADIIKRFDFFPSIHLSKQLGGKQELFASYSRRINRPQSRQLDPFPNYLDPYNVIVGNPALEPEYIDSYEIGYQYKFGYSFFSVEGFYRKTKNKITRIKTLQDDGSMLNTFENLNNDYALGGEIMANLNLTKWYELNASLSIYDYWLDGNVSGEGVSSHSVNWTTKLNSTFTFNYDISAQLMLAYKGPTVTAQGYREGMYMTSVAIKKDFFNNKFSATLSAKNLFGEMKREMTFEGDEYYSSSSLNMESPMIMLSLSYAINNYKKQRNGRDGEMESDMEVGF